MLGGSYPAPMTAKTLTLLPDALPKRQHTHDTGNSVKTDRLQNRHLKPFKSRAENGGVVDPRINMSGRPKILREESARYLVEKDKNGITNARKMIESMGQKVLSGGKDSVTAFRELRQTAETDERPSDQSFDNRAMTISMDVIKALAASVRDKRANAYELT